MIHFFSTLCFVNDDIHKSYLVFADIVVWGSAWCPWFKRWQAALASKGYRITAVLCFEFICVCVCVAFELLSTR